MNPSLSAYASLMGNYDFNATPFTPPGTKVLIHNKPLKGGTFGSHGICAWYIGPSIEHYRCYKCYIPSTGGTTNANMVELFRNKYHS